MWSQGTEDIKPGVPNSDWSRIKRMRAKIWTGVATKDGAGDSFGNLKQAKLKSN